MPVEKAGPAAVLPTAPAYSFGSPATLPLTGVAAALASSLLHLQPAGCCPARRGQRTRTRKGGNARTPDSAAPPLKPLFQVTRARAPAHTSHKRWSSAPGATACCPRGAARPQPPYACARSTRGLGARRPLGQVRGPQAMVTVMFCTCAPPAAYLVRHLSQLAPASGLISLQVDKFCLAMASHVVAASQPARRRRV